MNRGSSRSCTTGRFGTGRCSRATSRQTVPTGTRPSTIRRSAGCSPPSTSLTASRGLVATTTAAACTRLPSRRRTPRAPVTEFDALDASMANDARPGVLRHVTQRVHQDLPSAVYVVHGGLERALELLDEQLRADDVQCGGVDERARDRRHQPVQPRTPDFEVQPFLHACLCQGVRFGCAKRDEEAEERQLIPCVQEVDAQEPERVRREEAYPPPCNTKVSFGVPWS